MAAWGERIVGRRRELDALRTWLDAARAGHGRLVLCAGEPGIGKTRLGQELAGIALASGAAVAWGRCVEADGAPADWPWRQVLRALRVDPDAVLAGGVESPEERFRVFDGVVEALRTVADRAALVVILDDVHRADEPSLLVLRHLADRLADVPLLVLASFRDVEPAIGLPKGRSARGCGWSPRCSTSLPSVACPTSTRRSGGVLSTSWANPVTTGSLSRSRLSRR